jgi:enoyl-[acyl-carrier-protein] reductase (NADH)
MAESEEKHREKIVGWKTNKDLKMNPGKTKVMIGLDVTERVKGFTEFFGYAEKMSPLGNAPAEACADYCVTLFSDYTRYVTMQNLYHDGGFSNMGMSPALLENA